MAAPVIMYFLNKSVTTQKIKGKKVKDVFNNISEFLSNCTTGDANNPYGIDIKSYSAYDSNDDPEIAKEIVTKLNSLFGEGNTTPLSYHYPSGTPSENTKTEWVINNLMLKKALDYMSEGQPWPKYTFGPVELIVYYSFKLVDPETKNILPNQLNDSSLMIWFSRTAICSPTLYFPFESANDEFKSYLNKIDKFLPFELREKYLRLVYENKKKTGFIYKNI